jgi:hypothetical protein
MPQVQSTKVIFKGILHLLCQITLIHFEIDMGHCHILQNILYINQWGRTDNQSRAWAYRKLKGH